MKNRICVIGIYFGKLRDDFPLWLRSCKTNKDIDFLLLTDAETTTFDIPENVFVKCTTLSEVANLASEKLGFKVSLEAPYKLCDFKPAYGLIFQDLIKGYNYWGHCDFDMMFGRISHFVTRYHIEEYVHFMTQGHLSLYKNIPELADYIYLDGACFDAKTSFSNPKNYAFDENYGIGQIYKKHGIPQFEKNIFADISPIWKRMRRSPYYSWDVTPNDYPYQLFMWDSGKTFWLYIDGVGELQQEEVIYLHYQKRHLDFEIESLLKSNKIVFTPSRIIPWKGDITKTDIMNLNPRRPFGDHIDFIKWKIKKNFKLFVKKLR